MSADTLTATEQRLDDLLGRVSGGRVVFLTGAGVSAESGIPTFRGQEGYWTVGSREYHPQEMATQASFTKMPRECWRWYLYRRGVCNAAQPNAGHEALVRAERALKDRFRLITQNVDGLHRRAGNIQAIRCKSKWRHHGGGMHGTKWPLSEAPFTTSQPIQQWNYSIDMLPQAETGGNVFLRPCSTGIYCINIQLVEVFNIRSDNGSGKPLQIFKRIGKPGKIVQIFQVAGSIFPRDTVQHANCGTTSAEINRTIFCLEIIF